MDWQTETRHFFLWGNSHCPVWRLSKTFHLPNALDDDFDALLACPDEQTLLSLHRMSVKFSIHAQEEKRNVHAVLSVDLHDFISRKQSLSHNFLPSISKYVSEPNPPPHPTTMAPQRPLSQHH